MSIDVNAMDLLPFRRDRGSLAMGIDEALLEARVEGSIGDLVRFYQFYPSAVTLGRFQRIDASVRRDVCEREGIDITRRTTGGGTVFHDAAGEITYAVIMAVPPDLDTITRSYERICSGLVAALDVLGIEAVFSPINDVVIGTKKISGSAQTRRRGILLQHGTLLYKTDIEQMARVLNVSSEKLSDKHVASLAERVTTIERERGTTSFEDVMDALHSGFSSILGDLAKSELPPEVIERAHELENAKYTDLTYILSR
ncbi:MAG TPA: lipoate--protein ligase family protein [Methanomicrobia archaeon]|nr:lipoate--protein ligase family protein [Methanomicrobia archaeon]